MNAIEKLQLELTLEEIKWAIVKAPKLKIKEDRVTVIPNKARVRIYIDHDKEDAYFALKALKRQLPKIVVKGIPTLERAVISDEKGQRKLLVEGYGLRAVMTTEGE